jgi:hypothetical protein
MDNSTPRKRIETFFHSKTGKILPVLLIALLIGMASSTVYTYYVASSTATVKTPDVRLVAGSDSMACTMYPCTTVTVASTFDYATVAFSLFPSATNTPQPATYYSNLTTIQNKGTLTHPIKSIQLSGFTGGASLGTITVYYCTAFTEFNPDGTLVTPGNCLGSYTITSTSTGYQSVSGTFPVNLAAGSSHKGYFEVAAYALGTATAGSAITFNISIQWL